MRPRRLVLGLVLAIFLLPAAGCGSHRQAGGERERLEMWALGREGEVVQELLPEFERRHPGLRIEVQQIPFIAAHEKFLTAFVGRSTPDVAQLGSTWIPELAAIGALAGLDRQVAASRALAAGDYFPGSWDGGVIDGKVYAIPWYVDTRLLFYRSDLLRAAGCEMPPRTWRSWRRCMEQVKARAGPGNFAILLPVNEYPPPLALLLEAGSPLLRDGGRYGAFRDPRSRRAMAFYVDLFRAGLAPAVPDYRVANLYQLFAQGWFAMYIPGPWDVGEFRRRLPPALAGSWAPAPLPAPDEAGVGAGNSLVGGASLVIFRGSPHARAAWELIEYLSQPAQQARFYALMGDLPARRAAWQDPALAGDPQVRAFREQLQHAVPAPKVPEWEQIANRVWERAEEVIAGRKGLDQALAGLDADADRILEKRRWLLERRRPAPSREAALPIRPPASVQRPAGAGGERPADKPRGGGGGA
ncbi:MAG TPA: sugar ABC transporter substrate-binding protein [Thermoanaerobaculia bacterium]|nr:sugar ABC transporter substrate-binding protein [Thermoanaerobaculia bacterium]